MPPLKRPSTNRAALLPLSGWGGLIQTTSANVYLLGVQVPFPAVGAEFGGIQPSALQHYRELVGSTPATSVCYGCRYHLYLEQPRHLSFVQCDYINPQFCCDLGNAQPLRRTHPPPDVGPDGLLQ